MKAISESLYERGKHGIKYVRRRIPAALRQAYSNQTHITRSLGTSDLREAKTRARAELAKIEAEFVQARERLDLSRASRAAKRIGKLSDEQLHGPISRPQERLAREIVRCFLKILRSIQEGGRHQRPTKSAVSDGCAGNQPCVAGGALRVAACRW